MFHLYDSEFFNTKITQFDNDHIQIDFSSLVYERGKHKHEKDILQSNKSDLLSSGCSEVTSEVDTLLSDRCYCSASRTKRGVYSVARSNHWEWFVTFTFDNKVVDRSDFDLCKRKFAKFWDNLKRRKYPDLKYEFIVEMHKNLEGFHYHGVISGIPDSEFEYFRKVRGSWNKQLHRYNYYPAWNMKSYKLGFNSCTKVEDQGKVISYVCKYITKTAFLQSRLSQKFKHLYFHSNNLNQPDIKRVCIDTKKIDIYKFIEDNYPDFEVVYEKCRKSGYGSSWIDYIQLVRRSDPEGCD